MRLKTLEMVGFKTFPEKTVIRFSPGITAIAGPNGSGKSNIVDAIRWVMGETAPTLLRTKSLEDVIFSGSEGHPPTSFAEVNLILENSDGIAPSGFESCAEIQVTRRAYRDGESEFFINRSPCRLKDINELFLDIGSGSRGYCIIEQAKVQQVVVSRPEDVKLLIEEAAGVAKYRIRKREAVRKLESTRQNLLRVLDILQEVKRQIGALDRQARKARRYKKLRENLKVLECELLKRRLGDIEGNIESVRLRVEEAEKILADLRRERERVETEMQVLENRGVERKSRVDELRRKLQELNQEFHGMDRRFGEVSTEISGLRKRRQELLQERAVLLREVEEIGERLLKLSNEREEIEREMQRILSFQVDPETRRDELKAKMEHLKREFEGKRETLLGLQMQAKNLENNLSVSEKWARERSERVEAMAREEEGLEEEIRNLDRKLQALLEEMREASREREGLVARCESLSRQKAQISEELESLRRKREEARGELERVRSRMETLGQLVEGYRLFGDTVSFVMEKVAAEREDLQVMGVLGDLIRVEKGYEKAVEAALGEALKYIVVKNPEDGVVLIGAVKESEAGRVTVAPVTVRKKEGRGGAPIPAERGVTSISGIIDVPVEVRDVVDDLLSDVLLVQTLEDALNLWKNNGSWATYVTMDGEVLRPSGIMTGGRGKGERGILSVRAELEELESRGIDLEKALTLLGEKEGELGKRGVEISGELKDAEERVKQLDGKIHSLRLERDYLEKEREKVRKRLRLLRAEREHVEEERERILHEKSSAERQLAELRGKIQEVEGEISRLREELDGVTGELESVEASYSLSLRQREQLKERLSRIEVEEKTLQGLEEEKKTRSERCLKEAEGIDEELKRLEREREETGRALGQVQERRKDLEEKIRMLEEEIIAGEESLVRTRGQWKRLGEEIDKKLEALHAARERLVALETKKEELESVYEESYGGGLDEGDVPEEVSSLTVEEISLRVEETRRALESIGEVNVGAIEEREELQKRFDELTAQKEDLEKSMEDLKKVISRIDRESSERFLSTFEMVNGYFSELFPKLFMGGKGFLRLIENEDILESGVEIVPQPPGKRVKNVAALSNGEKALVGIAMFMSLFSVRPAPFLFLDEVDSPLDEKNVDRFYSLVRSISGDRQVILITHKKRSMELADYLYGVTMEKPGVSKVVTMTTR
ncbi:MAG: chromosome segregation protein SMC [Deltaproteobacteria bacterium]|nr:MAG: chromosome segregation protein SMC [Deltaproteobacteria bacterium]